MTPQEEQERYRYLQLKAKASSGGGQPQTPSIGSQISGWSKMPEKMAGATLDVMKDQVSNPIGKGALNLLSKTLPPTYSRLNLGLMGALEGGQALSKLPQIKNAGSELAGQLESAAGSPKGTLKHGFESAKNFFGAGKKSAGPAYESARPLSVHPELQDVFETKQMLEKSMELARRGELSPYEAFNARKSLDKLFGKSGYSEDVLTQMRKTFDSLAKSDSRIARGDATFAQGLKNESLRGILPKNKYGSTSAFKTGIMAAVPGIGTLLSPIVQGAGATGLGALSRMNPATIALLNSLMQQGSQGTSQ
jgi:hypothetical protein